MSNKAIETYKFQPFQFKVLEKNLYPLPICRFPAGHIMVCNNACLFSYGPYNRQESDNDGHGQSSEVYELWKYCFDSGEWKQITFQCTPHIMEVNKLALSGNSIIIYGSKISPFGAFSVHLGNLADEYKENGIQFEEFKVSGDVPQSYVVQDIVMDNTYTYSIGKMSPSLKHMNDDEEDRMNVHRLDLNTKKWDLLHESSGNDQEPQETFQHNLLLYNDIIYLIAGGYSIVNCTFSKIYMFHVATKQWQCLSTKPDHNMIFGNGYPSSRNGYSCVQCPEKSNLVYICGGRNCGHHFTDVWRFDLEKLQWEKLIWCSMPQSVFSPSTAVTPSGLMCFYGGMVSNGDLRGSSYRSNDIISVWITIPKLKIICWEAMMHYFKDQMLQSSEAQLKKIGIPPEFYERIIQARNPVQ